MRAVAAAVPVAARISRCEDVLCEAGANVVALPEGRVVCQPAFPHVYDANVVRRARLRLDDLDGQLARLAAPLERIGARHLQLVLDGADVPLEVAAQLSERGFHRDRLLAMMSGGPVQGGRRADILLRQVPHEAPWSDFADAMDTMNREEPWYAPAVSREVIGSLGQKARTGQLALFVAVDARDRRVVGSIGLGGLSVKNDAPAPDALAIVSVGTLPSWRGRGVARAMVLELIARARHRGAEIVYLMARADDWPKALYRKLGFEVAFSFDSWLRPPR